LASAPALVGATKVNDGWLVGWLCQWYYYSEEIQYWKLFLQ
jgi:hypothetical protein